MQTQEKNLIDSPAIQAHVNMMQGIINRLAGNCANCKTWAVTIIAGTLALAEIRLSTLIICLIATVILYLLDCYYFGIEKRLIKEQEAFLDKYLLDKDGVKDDTGLAEELFRIKHAPKTASEYLRSIMEGIRSFSMKLFYGAIFSVLFVLIYIYSAPIVSCLMEHFSSPCLIGG